MKSFLRKVLPENVKARISVVLGNVETIICKVFSCNGFMASAYYFLISREFDREHLSVLKGRLAYKQSLVSVEGSSALLRRNVHRLEKGLIMRPRRDIFAEGFIDETVDCFCNAVQSDKFCLDERKWAEDVLDEYFSVVGESSITIEAKWKYKQSVNDYVATEILCGGSKPYNYNELPEVDLSFDQLEKLFVKRRSVRWYQNKEVPMSLIQKAINVSTLAPSACNRQPYKFLVENKKEKAIELAKCAGGTTGFAENLTAMIVIVGDLSAYPFERDRHLIYIDASLAAMQLMLAFETLGLSSCPLNWPDVDTSEERIQKILRLPKHERIIMLMAVGYADLEGGIPFSQKKKDKLITKELV